MPLVVVVEKDGPYVLEGSHRLEALFELGAQSFPAVVAIDRDSIPCDPSEYEIPCKKHRVYLDENGKCPHCEAGTKPKRYDPFKDMNIDCSVCGKSREYGQKCQTCGTY
jgi:hypothetical protein